MKNMETVTITIERGPATSAVILGRHPEEDGCCYIIKAGDTVLSMTNFPTQLGTVQSLFRRAKSAQDAEQ